MNRDSIYYLPSNSRISNNGGNKTYHEKQVQDVVVGELFSPTGGGRESGHIYVGGEDPKKTEFVVGEMICEDVDELSYTDIVAAVSSEDICGPRGYAIPGESRDTQSFDISLPPDRRMNLEFDMLRGGHNLGSAEIHSPGGYVVPGLAEAPPEDSPFLTEYINPSTSIGSHSFSTTDRYASQEQAAVKVPLVEINSTSWYEIHDTPTPQSRDSEVASKTKVKKSVKFNNVVTSQSSDSEIVINTDSLRRQHLEYENHDISAPQSTDSQVAIIRKATKSLGYKNHGMHQKRNSEVLIKTKAKKSFDNRKTSMIERIRDGLCGNNARQYFPEDDDDGGIAKCHGSSAILGIQMCPKVEKYRSGESLCPICSNTLLWQRRTYNSGIIKAVPPFCSECEAYLTLEDTESIDDANDLDNLVDWITDMNNNLKMDCQDVVPQKGKIVFLSNEVHEIPPDLSLEQSNQRNERSSVLNRDQCPSEDFSSAISQKISSPPSSNESNCNQRKIGTIKINENSVPYMRGRSVGPAARSASEYDCVDHQSRTNMLHKQIKINVAECRIHPQASLGMSVNEVDGRIEDSSRIDRMTIGRELDTRAIDAAILINESAGVKNPASFTYDTCASLENAQSRNESELLAGVENPASFAYDKCASFENAQYDSCSVLSDLERGALKSRSDDELERNINSTSLEKLSSSKFEGRDVNINITKNEAVCTEDVEHLDDHTKNHSIVHSFSKTSRIYDIDINIEKCEGGDNTYDLESKTSKQDITKQQNQLPLKDITKQQNHLPLNNQCQVYPSSGEDDTRVPPEWEHSSINHKSHASKGYKGKKLTLDECEEKVDIGLAMDRSLNNIGTEMVSGNNDQFHIMPVRPMYPRLSCSPSASIEIKQMISDSYALQENGADNYNEDKNYSAYCGFFQQSSEDSNQAIIERPQKVRSIVPYCSKDRTASYDTRLNDDPQPYKCAEDKEHPIIIGKDRSVDTIEVKQVMSSSSQKIIDSTIEKPITLQKKDPSSKTSNVFKPSSPSGRHNALQENGENKFKQGKKSSARCSFFQKSAEIDSQKLVPIVSDYSKDENVSIDTRPNGDHQVYEYAQTKQQQITVGRNRSNDIIEVQQIMSRSSQDSIVSAMEKSIALKEGDLSPTTKEILTLSFSPPGQNELQECRVNSFKQDKKSSAFRNFFQKSSEDAKREITEIRSQKNEPILSNYSKDRNTSKDTSCNDNPQLYECVEETQHPIIVGKNMSIDVLEFQQMIPSSSATTTLLQSDPMTSEAFKPTSPYLRHNAQQENIENYFKQDEMSSACCSFFPISSEDVNKATTIMEVLQKVVPDYSKDKIPSYDKNPNGNHQAYECGEEKRHRIGNMISELKEPDKEIIWRQISKDLNYDCSLPKKTAMDQEVPHQMDIKAIYDVVPTSQNNIGSGIDSKNLHRKQGGHDVDIVTRMGTAIKSIKTIPSNIKRCNRPIRIRPSPDSNTFPPTSKSFAENNGSSTARSAKVINKFTKIKRVRKQPMPEMPECPSIRHNAYNNTKGRQQRGSTNDNGIKNINNDSTALIMAQNPMERMYGHSMSMMSGTNGIDAIVKSKTLKDCTTIGTNPYRAYQSLDLTIDNYPATSCELGINKLGSNLSFKSEDIKDCSTIGTSPSQSYESQNFAIDKKYVATCESSINNSLGSSLSFKSEDFKEISTIGTSSSRAYESQNLAIDKHSVTTYESSMNNSLRSDPRCTLMMKENCEEKNVKSIKFYENERAKLQCLSNMEYRNDYSGAIKKKADSSLGSTPEFFADDGTRNNVREPLKDVVYSLTMYQLVKRLNSAAKELKEIEQHIV